MKTPPKKPRNPIARCVGLVNKPKAFKPAKGAGSYQRVKKVEDDD
jgi:hypothetical protein